MRGFLTRLAAVAVAVVGLSTAGQQQAYAGTSCQQTNPATGECLVWVEVPDHPSDPGTSHDPRDTGSGRSCYWDPSKQGLSKPPAGPVACSSGAGYWSNTYNCYIKTLQPQPPAGDPNWRGHEPGDGAVYTCFQPQTGIVIYVWSKSAPPGAGAGPTPREVAELAIKRMGLRAIDIGIAPKPGPGSVGLVGMPVWMWATAPDEHTVGPISASASAGGITVTATARVVAITWAMGDGAEVVCRTAGTPYEASYGRRASPDCGHVYTTSSARAPGRSFAVSATSQWAITWSGAGQSGTIRLGGLTRSTRVTIGEAQVLVD